MANTNGLRGTGTLQSLLGRDVTKRSQRSTKRAASSNGGASAASDPSVQPGGRDSSPSQPTETQAEAPDAGPGAAAQSTAPAAAAAAPAASRRQPLGAKKHVPPPLPPRPTEQPAANGGSVRCPVCNKQLPADDARINAHIDTCLSVGTVSRRTAQASILSFASRGTSQQQQQQSSSQDAPSQRQQQQQQPAGRRRRSDAYAASAAALASSAAVAAGEILGAAAAAAGEILGAAAAAGGAAAPAPADAPIDLTADEEEASPPQRRQRKQQQQQQQDSVSWPSQPSQPTPRGGGGASQEVQQQQPRAPFRSAPAKTPPAGPPRRSPRKPGGGSSAQKQLVRGQQRLGGGLAAQAGGGLRCFGCVVVGRKFQRYKEAVQLGQRLSAELEPDNPRDSNAVLVTDAASRAPMGHLPHAVARQLAPLLRSSLVVVEAIVAEEPLEGSSAPLLVELQVSSQPVPPGATPGAAGHLAAALNRVEGAAAARLQEAPRASGERLQAAFAALLDTVQAHDAHLLAELETTFMASYRALPLPAQCLFLRLVQRKGPLFRLGSLSYKEIPDAAGTARQLAAAGLAALVEPAGGGGSGGSKDAAGSGGSTASWQQLADLLTVPDLVAVLSSRRFQLAGGTGAAGAGALRNRQQLLEALGRHAAISPASGRELGGWLLGAAGPVVALVEGACEAVARLQRLFFLSEGQSLSQFQAADVGATQYPTYTLHRTAPVFQSRAELLAYEAALRHAAALADALEGDDAAAAEAALAPAWAALDANVHKQERPGTPPFLRRYSAGWVYCAVGTAGVSLLERQRQYQPAIDRLRQLLGGRCCPARRGDWWVRLSTDLEHLSRPIQALETVEAALADDTLSSGDRLALQRRWLRLGACCLCSCKPPRRWRTPAWKDAALREPPVVEIVGRPINSAQGQKSRFWGLDDEQAAVEELALQYYASEDGGGWRGTHDEGGIWATLFGLLLWDALFAPVPDAFRTPFQTAPLDLSDPSFYPARQDVIEACLARIAAGEAPSLLQAAWDAHRGTLCRGVSWDRHPLPELQTVAECVGGPALAAVCRLLARDHAGWQGGMPDLLLWSPERREAKLAEVKGPRDRLSDQQRAWMAALEAAGMRAEVLKVKEPPAGGGGNGKSGGRGGRGGGKRKR